MIKKILFTVSILSFTALQNVYADQKSPILQPGAPGELTKPISAEKATDIANSSYTTADVYFMQGYLN